MYSKKIRTPAKINTMFHILLLLVAVPMAILTAEYASASPSIKTCRTLYYDSFFMQIQPSPCTRYFPMFTRQMIRDMEYNERFYALPSNNQ